ncbi:hypothetical protein [Thiohalomonas denitrificans]|uniref:hypothetical protein n=1 Tax=Thiohalomonas denitrificans TaxID=415747 RepID=UPI0026E9688E|nr:hypothetical protein [Thiohalomonas denitrificans]
MPMKPGLPSEPATDDLTVTIEPEIYNPIRLALLRFDLPIKTILGGRGVELHLFQDAWICFDLRLGYKPALAWTGFEAAARGELAGPVRARALLYNSNAQLFVHSVLPELAIRMQGQLRAAYPPGARIVAFPGRS